LTWRGRAFELPTSALRTNGIESLPLLGTLTARDWKGEGWDGSLPNDLKMLPTPRTSDQNGAGEHGQGGMDLRTAVKLLPTPVAHDDGKTPDAHMAMKRRMVDGERKTITSLTVLAKAGFQQPPSNGASTSPLSGDGKPSTGLRLNPLLVAWMMGTPSCGECGREWTDPDCPHSATAFTSTSGGLSGMPSTNLNGGGREVASDASRSRLRPRVPPPFRPWPVHSWHAIG
jgi:hypothetical protein